MKSLESYRESDRNDDEKNGLLAGDSLLRSIMTEMRRSSATPLMDMRVDHTTCRISVLRQ